MSKNNASVFDLRNQSSTHLAQLEIGLNCGIAQANAYHLKETEETLIAFRMLVQSAIKVAAEREAEAWASASVKEILGTVNQ